MSLSCDMVWAQVPLPTGIAAIVNGINIPQAWLDQNVQANIAQGQKDSPELRQAIKQELIGREVVAQEASRLNLDKTPTAQMQFAQLRQNFLVELALNDYLTKHPVTEADLRALYDRQLKEIGDSQQYKLSLITVANETEAKAVLARLQKGENFAKLAREKSIDASKKDGGALDWLLPNQIVPPIATVIVNMAKGATSATPIQTATGWNIVKIEDKRPFKAPSFEESKNQVANAIAQQLRVEYAQRLRSAAKISE